MLQIALIAAYFSGIFFDVRSAFKGDFQMFSCKFHDESCLNLIAIESRTQGHHEELEILLQKCLISSRFNQKLSLKKERTSIYKNFIAKNPHGSIR